MSSKQATGKVEKQFTKKFPHSTKTGEVFKKMAE